MVPADQCLDAVHVAGVQVDLRLVVQDELVAGHRGSQLIHGAQPGRVLGVVGGAVDVMSVPGDLGPVHSDIGLAQQSAQARTVIGVVGEQRDPDAGMAVESHVMKGERLAKRRAQLDGDLHGLVVAGVIEHHRELVAAQAC